jgi:hypothetical protein
VVGSTRGVSYPRVRDAYASLKKDLARAHRDDRNAYTDAKTAFFTSIVEMARTGDDRAPTTPAAKPAGKGSSRPS